VLNRDAGTPFDVANHRLTSEILEEICKDEDVLEVTREYTGSIGLVQAFRYQAKPTHNGVGLDSSRNLSNLCSRCISSSPISHYHQLDHTNIRLISN
jgi:hypothetical protein